MAEKPINEMTDTEIEAELWSHGIDINDTYRRLQRVLGLVRGLRDAEADRYTLLSACKRALTCIEDHGGEHWLTTQYLRDAIAKAEPRG